VSVTPILFATAVAGSNSSCRFKSSLSGQFGFFFITKRINKNSKEESLMSLKDGKLLVFKGTNWKLAGDPKWEECASYVPNGHEKRIGERVIDGVNHVVFRLCDDDFGAQPKTTVEG